LQQVQYDDLEDRHSLEHTGRVIDIPMKTRFFTSLLALAFLALVPLGKAAAQVIFTTNINANSIGKYDAVTGAVINATFITDSVNLPFDVAHDDNYLYVANYGSNTIGRYDINTGEGGVFFGGLNRPDGVSYYNGNLYVANSLGNTIGLYDAATGSEINASFISTGLGSPAFLEVVGGIVYVPNFDGNSISTYDATTGAIIDLAFITGLNQPNGIAFSGGSLYVTNGGSNSVGVYDAASGEVINATLITGINAPQGIVINGNGNLAFAGISGAVYEFTTAGEIVNGPWFVAVSSVGGMDVTVVPEPGSVAMLAFGMAFLAMRKKQRRAQSGISGKAGEIA
jgi:YVTN family beta-propeller protein